MKIQPSDRKTSHCPGPESCNRSKKNFRIFSLSPNSKAKPESYGNRANCKTPRGRAACYSGCEAAPMREWAYQFGMSRPPRRGIRARRACCPAGWGGGAACATVEWRAQTTAGMRPPFHRTACRACAPNAAHAEFCNWLKTSINKEPACMPECPYIPARPHTRHWRE